MSDASGKFSSLKVTAAHMVVIEASICRNDVNYGQLHL